MATIPVHWVIPSLKYLLDPQRKLFCHDSFPGISWELVLGRESLRINTIIGQNKSPAAVVSAGFRLFLSALVGTAGARMKYHMYPRGYTRYSPSQWVTPVYVVDIEQLDAEKGPLVLSGEINVELPTGNPVLRGMYESGRFSDLAIKAGNQTFNVHMAVLAHFEGFVDLLSPGQTELEISASAEAVAVILEHLYECPLLLWDLTDLSCEVLLLTKTFNLETLTKLCEQSLLTAIKVNNVFKLAAVAASANSAALIERTYDFAARNIEALYFSDDWTKLKADYPVTAMSICERIIDGLSEKATKPGQFQVACPSTIKGSIAAPFQVPVRWEISDFQNLMENSLCGFSITCLQKFSHESMPGIAWELILYPNGKEDYSHHVALFMRPILTSDKKSQATAPFGGFSLRFEVVNQNVASAPPPEQNLPIQQFRLQSELGIAQFAHQPLIVAHCLNQENRMAVLVGNILIEPTSRQVICNRKCLESGRYSDFTIKVVVDSLPVHKLIVSDASSVMQAMFDMDCAESNAGFVEIKETSVEAVRALLQFWYGDPVCFDGLDELSTEVYKLANRYQDFELRQICEDALLRMIFADNVVYLAAFAADQNCEALEKSAAKVIIENADVLKSQVWTHFKEDNFNLSLAVVERIITKYRKICGAVFRENADALWCRNFR